MMEILIIIVVSSWHYIFKIFFLVTLVFGMGLCSMFNCDGKQFVRFACSFVCHIIITFKCWQLSFCLYTIMPIDHIVFQYTIHHAELNRSSNYYLIIENWREIKMKRKKKRQSWIMDPIEAVRFSHGIHQLKIRLQTEIISWKLKFILILKFILFDCATHKHGAP